MRKLRREDVYKAREGCGLGIVNALIRQAKNPKGFVGRAMLKIMNAAHGSMTAWGLSKVWLEDTATVLDIGCGGGKTIKTLSRAVKNGKIYGVDVSKDAVLASGRKNARDVRTGKVVVIQAGVSAMPFQDGFFDGITAFQTHYFWPDLQNDIKEIVRILKPGGRLLLVSELYKMNYHMKAYKTPEAFTALMQNSGFSDVCVYRSTAEVCWVGTK
jgi:ubiquinone/menaquinone biosynthesis C-methylase UbiE